MRTGSTILMLLILLSGSTMAQNLVYVDKQGVLRWTKDKKEAAFFGVNYTIPFAYGYRSHKAANVNLEAAIDADVRDMKRLELDAFRVHVWDVEISDSTGNLLDNEHLRLFDYLLLKLKQANIRVLVTPIAFWGNGYPEPDEKTPGFSTKYGKGPAVVLEDAIKAQENYLKQFFKHVNPYTKLSYTADANVIAMEINNEPHHSGPKEKTTGYVNRLAAAVKSAGWTKPIFYNISESPSYADAVVKAKVDGHSFQWYPTGLVANHEQKGNFLPNVDQYRIPFGDTIAAFANRAKMVYEFDAADVMQPIMYPAMARSYRSAGFQWATQFAYDPGGTAGYNTEYQTHYLNLFCTPAKAISLMIASKVFHKLPRLKQYGSFPADTLFDVFRISYKEQLSLMNDDTAFYYSNSTTTSPKNVQQLKHVAGVGSSPMVKYEGKGAYFLDKINEDMWKLEVMPDAIAVRDPFDHTSLSKMVTRLQWRVNKMQLMLPKVEGTFWLRPGIYFLSKGVIKRDVLPSFTAQPAIVHAPLTAVAADVVMPGSPLELYNTLANWNYTMRYYYPDWRNLMGWQFFFRDKIAGRKEELTSFTKLVVRARSPQQTKLKVSLISVDADAFSAEVPLSSTWQDIEIPLNTLQRDSFLLLPRPYPGFLPLYFKSSATNPFDITKAEKLEVRFSMGNVEVETVWLKR